MGPRIAPFHFGDGDTEYELGMSAQISCFVLEGDLPLDIGWTFQGRTSASLTSLTGVVTTKTGARSSVLDIESLAAGHAGNYTCHARNAAAARHFTAQLDVYGIDRSRAPLSETLIGSTVTSLLLGTNEHLGWPRLDPLRVPSFFFFASMNLVPPAFRAPPASFSFLPMEDFGDGNDFERRRFTRRDAAVRPKIAPFAFDDGLMEGDHVHVSCVLAEGDLPVELGWTLQPSVASLASAGLSTTRLGPRSSVLQIESASAGHAGDYTCIAHNAAGSHNFTARLKVSGSFGSRFRRLCFVIQHLANVPSRFEALRVACSMSGRVLWVRVSTLGRIQCSA